MNFNRANHFESMFHIQKDRSSRRESIISIRKLDLRMKKVSNLNILTEGSVVSANILARSELRGEGGFPDFRRTQHAYFVSRHPFVAGFLPRLHVGELRGRTEKSEGEKERNKIQRR